MTLLRATSKRDAAAADIEHVCRIAHYAEPPSLET